MQEGWKKLNNTENIDLITLAKKQKQDLTSEVHPKRITMGDMASSTGKLNPEKYIGKIRRYFDFN